ncbi:MAG: CARDB domain-containing protein [Thermoplasmata archaeon]
MAHAEVDPAMNARPAALLVLALLLAPAVLATVGALAPAARAAGTTAVTGSLTGPTIVATGSTTKYEVSGFGGPAVAANGTVVGNITFYATVVGSNLTGVTLLPSSSAFTNNQSKTVDLAVANASETLTIDVMVSSVYQGQNQSINFTNTVHVVQPYVISATIVASSTWVSAFTVRVTLDGTVIGNVSVPALQAGGTYQVTFEYPTLGLSTGDHTFAISLAQEHGLVTFANGQTQYSQTVYVTGPGPDYTLWYVAGIVAFFGAIFIFLTRVAARRRGAARR